MEFGFGVHKSDTLWVEFSPDCKIFYNDPFGLDDKDLECYGKRRFVTRWISLYCEISEYSKYMI